MLNNSCDHPVRTWAPALRLCVPVTYEMLPAQVNMRALLVSMRGDTPLIDERIWSKVANASGAASGSNPSV